MALEIIGKFIGPDEIESTAVADFTTPEGKEIIEVTFKGGRKHIFSAETLDYIITDEVSDHNSVQDKKLMPIVRKIMSIIAEHDINVGELEMLFKQVGMNLDKAFNQATSYLWFKDDKEFVPGFDPMHGVSLLMAERVLREIRKDVQKDS